jgi:hypothetical protein
MAKDSAFKRGAEVTDLDRMIASRGVELATIEAAIARLDAQMGRATSPARRTRKHPQGVLAL